jgi:hypothetical protein
MGKNGHIQLQGTSVLEAFHNPFALPGQGIFLIGPVFGHMHLQAGAVFLGQGNRLFRELLTYGKRGMQLIFDRIQSIVLTPPPPVGEKIKQGHASMQ